jgi:hypothetical protein
LRRPVHVAHADWGISPRKRQVCLAKLQDDSSYRIERLDQADSAAIAVGDIRAAMHVTEPMGQLFAGFDFPIGLPRAYAAKGDIDSFRAFLAQMGKGRFERFGDVASTAAEISVELPFYPPPGRGARKVEISEGLGISYHQLWRRCELGGAESLFWTLGPKQVGRGAVAGWEMFAASCLGALRLWPFDGSLDSLLDGDASHVVAGEAYPAEFYKQIWREGVRPDGWSKAKQSRRKQCVPLLVELSDRLCVTWDPEVLGRLEEGFAPPDTDDHFDAVVGVLGMIAVINGDLATGEPKGDETISRVEGWILGRPSDAEYVAHS